MGNLVIPYAISDDDPVESSVEQKKETIKEKKKGIYYLTVPSIPHPKDKIGEIEERQVLSGDVPEIIDLRSQIERPYTSKHPAWQKYPMNIEIVARQLECMAMACDNWKGRISRQFWNKYSHRSLNSFRDIYDAVKRFGMIPESYDQSIDKPTTRVAARPFRLLTIKLLNRSVQLWQSFLSASCPIAISLAIYGDHTLMPPIYEFPEQNDSISMVIPALVVGYDSKRDIFIVQGPFTKEWGEEGYIALPYECIESTSVILEMWVCKFSKHLKKNVEIDFDTVSFDVSNH